MEVNLKLVVETKRLWDITRQSGLAQKEEEADIDMGLLQFQAAHLAAMNESFLWCHHASLAQAAFL